MEPVNMPPPEECAERSIYLLEKAAERYNEIADVDEHISFWQNQAYVWAVLATRTIPSPAVSHYAEVQEENDVRP